MDNSFLSSGPSSSSDERSASFLNTSKSRYSSPFQHITSTIMESAISAVNSTEVITKEWTDFTFHSIRYYVQNSGEEITDERLCYLKEGYILIKQIGRGGFAVIWKALSEKPHNQSHVVAIKIATATNYKYDYISWLKNEADILQELSEDGPHPNIIRMFNQIPDKKGKRHALVLEIASCSMKCCMKEIWSEEMVRFIFNQLILGFNHIRSLNVAHLDIKPSNILITKKYSDPNNWSNWNAKICDFGLATDNLKSNSIRTDVQTTTLRYMSPQRVNRVLDASADIWAIGVMIYEALHGKKPFNLDNCQSEEEIRNYLCGDNSINLELKPDLSVECAGLVRSLLDKDSKTRINRQDLMKHSFWNVPVVPVPKPKQLSQLRSNFLTSLFLAMVILSVTLFIFYFFKYFWIYSYQPVASNTPSSFDESEIIKFLKQKISSKVVG